jgi:sucrose phosphorylase
MLSPSGQKKIEIKLRNIYSSLYSKIEITQYFEEITQIIKRFNKKNKKKNKLISEKTSIVICYGDSVFNSKQKYQIKGFQNFYQKKLKNYFNTVHFLPFYPSSSDSGFAVKDHYKIDSRIGKWSDISNFAKKKRCNG